MAVRSAFCCALSTLTTFFETLRFVKPAQNVGRKKKPRRWGRGWLSQDLWQTQRQFCPARVTIA
jgi:hypothetical protein